MITRDHKIIEERFQNNLKIIEKLISIEIFNQMVLDYLLGYTSDIKLDVGENMKNISYSEISKITECLNSNYVEKYLSDKLTSDELAKFKNVKFSGEYAFGNFSLKKKIEKIEKNENRKIFLKGYLA